MAKLRIAIIAPPVTTVPPFGQGGLETILANKIETLIQMGHEVHLFGAGETNLKEVQFHQIFTTPIAKLEIDPIQTEASRKIRLEAVYMTLVLLELLANQDKFEVIFNHTRATELVVAPMVEKFKIPFLNVFHLPILPEHAKILQAVPELKVISISDDQRADFPYLKNFVATIHNGIAPEKYSFSDRTDDYLLWVGTIGFHKNPLDAIKTAKTLDEKIILMGKIRDEDYFHQFVEPEIDNKRVIYLGELDYEKKLKYFQEAKAALFPTKIREACPVTPLELTMCGTPVVAYPAGGTKELIKDGVNGFLVEDVKAMVKKTKEAFKLNREKCHLYAQENFSAEAMAKKYLKVYEEVK